MSNRTTPLDSPDSRLFARLSPVISAVGGHAPSPAESRPAAHEPVQENAPHKIPPALRQAFEETDYIVHHQPPFVLRIGQPSPELDALLQAHGQGCAAFITAWNPMAQALPEAENRARQQALQQELSERGLQCIAGIGQHPANGWPGEESVLAMGLQAEAALALCGRYGQLACVVYRAGGKAQLLAGEPLK